MQSTAIAEGYAAFDEEKDAKPSKADFFEYLEIDNKDRLIELLKKEMQKAAANLEFEKAAELRDRIAEMMGGTLKPL